MAADYSCKTISPTDPKGEKIDAIFPGDLTLKWYKYASVRYQNLRAAKWVLEHPERIFYGVREYNEGGWCYTARPPTWYIRQDQEVTFP